MLLKHQIDLIYKSYMDHAYAVCCLTIAENVIHFPTFTAEKKHFFVQLLWSVGQLATSTKQLYCSTEANCYFCLNFYYYFTVSFCLYFLD